MDSKIETRSKSTLEMVREFHIAFSHPIFNLPTHNKDLIDLRVILFHEELREFEEAVDAKDEVKVLDALLDLQYILDGAFLSLGYWKVKNSAFNEVHKSNMAKLDKEGKPIKREDGKILKPKGWTPPNLQKFIDQLKMD